MNEAHPSSAGKPAAAPPENGRAGRGFFASEWGLMTLALVLAVLLWLAVRDTVVTTKEIPNVKVNPVTSPGFWAHVKITGTLKLKGSPGEIEEAQKQLDSRGNVIDIVIADSSRDERDINASDRYSFEAFPERLVESAPTLSGSVFRLLERSIDVEDPLVAIPGNHKGVVAKVELVEPRRFTVFAPPGALGATIRPDRIDATAFLDGNTALTLPQTYDLTFGDWRTDDGKGGEIAVRRLGVQIHRVTATVTFQVTTSRTIDNRLVEDVPAGHTYALRSREDSFREGRYRGDLWAPDPILNELEASKDKWCFFLHVLPPETPLKPGEKAEGQATVEWLPLSPALLQRAARGLIRFDRQPLRVDLTAR